MLGYKARKLRRQRSISQTQAAEQLGISASYLNLIEHNRRPITLPLLMKMARLLDVDLNTFSDDEEARIRADLAEALGDPMFADEGLSGDDLDQLTSSLPAVGRTLLTLYSAYGSARDNVQALSERLSNDVFLSTSVHELLTLLTSIRSFSEILHDNIDLSSGQRKQFLGILIEESAQLTEVINRLLEFAKGSGLRDMLGGKSASEEVTDFIESNGNYFAEIEDAAEQLRLQAGLGEGSLQNGLERILKQRHGMTVETVPWNAQQGTAWCDSLKQGRLFLSEVLGQESINFQLARRIGLLSCEDIFKPHLEDGTLSSDEPRAMSRDALAKYFAGAVLMPYDDFFKASTELRYDIELLKHRFAASFEQVCHRLTTLRRPSAMGVPFHFLRIDIAGNISKRFSGSGMRIPRFGGVCPRWNVHSAFMTPGAINSQLAILPDGSTYFCLARTIIEHAIGHRIPASHQAISIGCDVTYANRLVYADGVDLGNLSAAMPVGISCRLCERADCRQRAFPMLIREKGEHSAVPVGDNGA